MRELSLHILDLIENSIRAGASLIVVGVSEDADHDRLEIRVEDNGAGLTVPSEKALDPYFTTKEGKRTGLGLSLFKASAELAGGGLSVHESAMGGVAVIARMKLEHVDRPPLGDLAATLSSVVCTNPGLDLWCRISSRDRQCVVCASEVAKRFNANERCGLTIARRFSEEIKTALAVLSDEDGSPAAREGSRVLIRSRTE